MTPPQLAAPLGDVRRPSKRQLFLEGAAAEDDAQGAGDDGESNGGDKHAAGDRGGSRVQMLEIVTDIWRYRGDDEGDVVGVKEKRP